MPRNPENMSVIGIMPARRVLFSAQHQNVSNNFLSRGDKTKQPQNIGYKIGARTTTKHWLQKLEQELYSRIILIAIRIMFIHYANAATSRCPIAPYCVALKIIKTTF